ncbi:hypothetical protein NC652_017670 [Populus alba x Populus x berolinensis]|uniref:Uncharacterized protein n=1 Tax=Populus alba x Populus x berolinensis TaxID=444605 RepID=A0AAD6W0P5_9ROSI|nr:hypothetical protein NC652_017670 [Populus alba x Populus x berolinensis]KAJ6994742.1 hypothetical protein NC653_017519 [Populus alba x Populus x berolinensis]
MFVISVSIQKPSVSHQMVHANMERLNFQSRSGR